MRCHVIGWILATGLLTFATDAWGLEVEARLARPAIHSGESVQLTLRVLDGDGSESPASALDRVSRRKHAQHGAYGCDDRPCRWLKLNRHGRQTLASKLPHS